MVSMFALLLLPVAIAHQQRFILDSGSAFDPNNVYVRLVQGHAAHEGRVEVFRSMQWGTICDDHWSEADAAVICSMLGYSRAGSTPHSSAFYGQGSGRIWLDEVRCSGTEKSIETCPSNPWGINDCSHSEDVGVSCQTSGQLDNFLLFTNLANPKLIRMDVASQSYVGIPTAQSLNPVDIDYDPIDGRIYWSDVGLKQIRSATIDGTDERVVRSLGNNSTADGIAVDSSSRLIFYTDTGYDHIASMTLDGSSHTIVINTGLDEPRAIVLDVNKRKMYWSDWGSTAKIESANYDGSNRQTIVQSGIVWPNGLALDSSAGKIYWADARTDRIEVADVDGSNRQVLLQEADSHYFGLTLYEHTLYFTDWTKTILRTLPTSGGTPSYFGPPGFHRLSGIHYYRNRLLP